VSLKTVPIYDQEEIILRAAVASVSRSAGLPPLSSFGYYSLPSATAILRTTDDQELTEKTEKTAAAAAKTADETVATRFPSVEILLEKFDR